MITVVIPVYNRADLVCRTLDSVASQTWRPLRVVIVDNDSTDGSGEAVRQWIAANAVDRSLDVTLLHETRRGAAAARNCGLRAVDTEWVMFFDSDDEMLPAHVERVARMIEAHPDAGIVGWETRQQLPDLSFQRGRFATTHMEYNNLVHGVMSTLRYCVRTELIRSVGGWNEDVHVWDDMELGIRLLARHPHVVMLRGEPTVVSYFTDESLTGSRPQIERCLDTLEVCRRDLAETGQSRYLPWLSYRMMLLAVECRRHGERDRALELMRRARGYLGTCGRMMLNLCYMANRIVPRGTYLLFIPVGGR